MQEPESTAFLEMNDPGSRSRDHLRVPPLAEKEAEMRGVQKVNLFEKRSSPARYNSPPSGPGAHYTSSPPPGPALAGAGHRELTFGRYDAPPCPHPTRR
jgi:hypothetical protein